MTEIQDTRQIWTGTLVKVETRIVDGIETVQALMRQGPSGAASYRGETVSATGSVLAALRRLFREGQDVCLLGEVVGDTFRVIAPAIAPQLAAGINRRTAARASTDPVEAGQVVSLAGRRRAVEDEPEILAGFA